MPRDLFFEVRSQAFSLALFNALSTLLGLAQLCPTQIAYLPKIM